MAEFSYVHVLLALAIAGAAWLLIREILRPRPAAPPMPPLGELYGVHGWLVWLVSILIFIGPGVGVGRLLQALRSTVTLMPALADLPQWHAYTLATWMMFAAASLLSIAAGVGLEKRRDPGAVNFARVVLWIIGPVITLMHGLLIPLALFGKTGASPFYALTLTYSIIWAVAWTAYLSWSRRVRNTYGRGPLAEAAPVEAGKGEEQV